MSKFAALPDIDNAPDVYESEAVPTIQDAAVGEAEEPESADIARPRVSVPDARKKFGNAIVDARGADFDGMRGYRVAEREVYGDDETEAESAAETLARLTREVAQLKEQISSNAIQEGSEARKKVLADGVRVLEAELDGFGTARGGMVGAADQTAQQALMKQLAAFKELKPGSDATVAASAPSATKAATGADGKLTYELFLDSTHPASQRVAVLSDLDARLAALEKSLGSVTGQDADAMITTSGAVHAPQPLLATVEKMEQQLNLLAQPRALDILALKVRRLAGDLERIAEARTRLAAPLAEIGGSAANSRSPSPARVSGNASAPGASASGDPETTIPAASIRSLFSTLSSLQPFIPQIPKLLLRLRALQQLHTDAATLLDSASAVSSGQDRAEAELRELKGICVKLEKSMSENAAVMQGNVESLGARIERLKAEI